MVTTHKTESTKSGHRERLRQSFLKGNLTAELDLLELLLTYCIPQKDVRPLAQELLAKFGTIEAVLAADYSTLKKFKGLGEYSATLFKLVNAISSLPAGTKIADKPVVTPAVQATFPDLTVTTLKGTKKVVKKAALEEKQVIARPSTLFSYDLLKETIDILPMLPLTEDINTIKEYLRNNLHFSALETRQHYAAYIAMRLFPSGKPDLAILKYARKYAGRQELKDIAFYRFCLAEPLMSDVVLNFFRLNVGAGQIARLQLRNYLTDKFPQSKNIQKGARAIVQAMTACGLARSDTKAVFFTYRDISLPSFAFILHSEYPTPGMYDIGKLEENRMLKTMLWDTSKLLTSLYELRNKGIISKVSEIDTVRQFTTRYNLGEVIERL